MDDFDMQDQANNLRQLATHLKQAVDGLQEILLHVQAADLFLKGKATALKGLIYAADHRN